MSTRSCSPSAPSAQALPPRESLEGFCGVSLAALVLGGPVTHPSDTLNDGLSPTDDGTDDPPATATVR